MKSIEEAAIEYAKLEYEDLYDEDSLDVDITIKDFTKGVEFAQRWIPVEEELPVQNVTVLMKNQYGFYGIGELIKNKWRFFTVESYAGMLNLKMYNQEDIAKVTHWRPIEYK